MAEKKTYAVGDEIFTECGKCKSEMYHIITTMVEDEIKKVMCKGCNTTHVYRDKSKKKAKVAKTKTTKTRTRRVGRKDWGKLTADMPEDEFVDYDMRLDFSDNKGIRHKKFGNGVITKILADTQIEVVFEDSTKVLVQNYD